MEDTTNITYLSVSDTPTPSSPPTSDGAPYITCFACSRCEYPICDSNDLILQPIRQGTGAHVFAYCLDGLLDMEDQQVPCYSAADMIQTSAVVSEDLMEVPLSPAAQVVALESIVQSRKNWVRQRSVLHDRLPESQPMAATATGRASNSTLAARSDGGGLHGEPPRSSSPVGTDLSEAIGSPASTATQAAPIVRRYGDLSESRIDLVCVKESVLELGLQVCTQDRSAVAMEIGDPAESGHAADGSSHSVHEGSGEGHANVPKPTVISEASFSRIPADVMRVATAAVVDTVWSSPGNLQLREEYVEVNRSTLSARASWFRNYQCVSKVQCPDCHQALGFMFHILDAEAVSQKTCEADERGKVSQEEQGAKRSGTPEPLFTRLGGDRVSLRESGTDGSSSNITTSTPAEEARVPCAKKTRGEDDVQYTSTSVPHSRRATHRSGGYAGDVHYLDGALRRGPQDPMDNSTPLLGEDGEVDDDAVKATPARFVGLELKRVVQRQRTLRQFQDRYSKSRDLQTFRGLFPEAEELQSLYCRLLGLRTQVEIYNSLLRRHKEQNDVQLALLNSSRLRIQTYDEKVQTMQQIIEAQRLQMSMQAQRLQVQEEEVQCSKRRCAMQERQIGMEQLLRSQQSSIIESQKKQLQLLKSHFQATQEQAILAKPCEDPLDVHPPPPYGRFGNGEGLFSADLSVVPIFRDTIRRVDRARDASDDVAATSDGEKGKPREAVETLPVEEVARAHAGSSGTPPVHLCGIPASAARPPTAGTANLKATSFDSFPSTSPPE